MRLPSLNALRAFEAAARHQSFARAAAELHVSEGAISRHIKLLEEELGLPLFFRRARKVELTEHGRKLLPVLSKAFKAIAAGFTDVAAEAPKLRLLSQPSFSIRWLIPRLDQFRQSHPAIQVNVTTGIYEWPDAIGGGYDLAFGCGPERPDGWEAMLVVPAAMTPVCAPRLLKSKAVASPGDLAGFNLLHTTPDRRDWRIWLEEFAPDDVDPMSGETFPVLDMAIQAAVLGQGMAMGDLTLLADELESGKLICPLPDLALRRDAEDYYAYGPSARWNKPRVLAFRQWLESVARNG
jgi:LysR family transcriptional regulator, glycine cleavage system transcriptional activator